MLRTIIMSLGLIVAASAEATEDPTLAIRGGAGVELGIGGVGPSVGLEVHHLDDSRVFGARLDAAYRTLIFTEAAAGSLQGELGRLAPMGPVRLQGTLTGGATLTRLHGDAFCAPLDPGPCTGDVDELRILPEVGGSLGLVNRRGNLWVGVRGRALSPSLGLGFTVGTARPMAARGDAS